MNETEGLHQSVAQVILEKDAFMLNNSLKELKDLRTQLHYAADFCESSFLKSKQKDQVVENTKEYICRAVITAVDHLGSASEILDKIINQDKTVPEAKHRLDCLSQRLLSCKEFSQQFALADLCWNNHPPRHHSRYLNHGNSISKTDDAKVTNFSDVKSAVLKDGMDSSEVKSENVVQKWPKVLNTRFEFQDKSRKPRRTKLVQVSFQRSSELLSLIRWTKRISRVN